MSSIDDPLHPGSRRWIAWKLVQLAHRIYNAEFYERITVTHRYSGEEVAAFEIASDMYGSGVMTYCGPEDFGDYRVDWDEFTPDWLEES